jgi:hypothetical protein
MSGMNDQKNKQQQPSQHSGKQDSGQQGQKPNKQDQDKQQDKQHVQDRRHVQGDMNQPDQPDKKTQIDDNPDETKKKIPNMEKKH